MSARANTRPVSKYRLQRHPPRVVRPAVDLTVTRADGFQSGERVAAPGTAVQAVTLWNLERQHAKQFRRQCADATGRPMSARQFRKARKAGRRVVAQRTREVAQALKRDAA